MAKALTLCLLFALVFGGLLLANCRETGLFVHVTDVHFDGKYLEGAKLEVNEPKGDTIGCRTIDPTIPKNQTAGKFGAIRGHCDLPKITIESAFQFIANYPQKIDFILYGGDNNPHDTAKQTPNEVLYAMSNVSLTFKKYFHQKIPVFPILGNHESFPIDQFAPNYEASKWVLDANYNHWIDMFEEYLDEKGKESFKKNGFYSVKIQNGFRLLTINSVIWDVHNFFVRYLGSGSDPLGQFAFIEQTLSGAKAAGEKVMILGHIPPTFDAGDGAAELLDHYQKRFNEIVGRYRDTIVGQFYGHTHFHSFILGRNVTSGAANSVAMVSSSLTTWSNVNPGFRIFVYDKKDFTLLDSIFIRTDIAKSNARGELIWEPLANYADEKKFGNSFTKFGGLTVEAFQDFANRMEVNDNGAWDAYAKLFRAGATHDSFDNKPLVCRRLCTIQFNSKEAFNACYAKCPK